MCWLVGTVPRGDEFAVCGGALAPLPVYDLLRQDHTFPRCPGDGAYPRNSSCNPGGRAGMAEPNDPFAPVDGIHRPHQLSTVSLALAIASVWAGSLVRDSTRGCKNRACPRLCRA